MVDDQRETSPLDCGGGAVVGDDILDVIREEMDAAGPEGDVHRAGAVSLVGLDLNLNLRH